MKATAVSCEPIQILGYDEEQRTLRLEYYDAIFDYYGVHPSVYYSLMAAASKLEYFDKVIAPAGFKRKRI